LGWIIRLAAAAVVAWLVADALVVNTVFVFVTGQPINPLRSAVFAVGIYLNLALSFSVFYLSLGCWEHLPWSKRATTAIYQSIRTITTAGPDGSVQGWAKSIAAAELLVGIYFLAIIIAGYAAWASAPRR
jgi:hypothetical protein